MSSYGAGFEFNTPYSPGYVDYNSLDKMEEIINSRSPQGSGVVGVPLSKYGEDIPLEFAFGIRDEKTGSSRPTLLPLFRTRYVDTMSDNSPNIRNQYEKLRNLLSPEMKFRLEQNKAIRDVELRDPDLTAFDQSIRFAAQLMTWGTRASQPIPAGDMSLEAARSFQELPQQAKQVLLSYGQEVDQFIQSHLEEMGRNDPRYELFTQALTVLRQARHLI